MILPFVLLAVALQQTPQSQPIMQDIVPVQISPSLQDQTLDAAAKALEVKDKLIQDYKDEIKILKLMDLYNKAIIAKQDRYILWLKKHQTK